MGIVRALGEVCGELRHDAGVRSSKIAYHMKRGKGGDARAVERFEQGITQPHDLDSVIRGYAMELGIPAVSICRMAVDRLSANDQPSQRVS